MSFFNEDTNIRTPYEIELERLTKDKNAAISQIIKIRKDTDQVVFRTCRGEVYSRDKCAIDYDFTSERLVDFINRNCNNITFNNHNGELCSIRYARLGHRNKVYLEITFGNRITRMTVDRFISLYQQKQFRNMLPAFVRKRLFDDKLHSIKFLDACRCVKNTTARIKELQQHYNNQ